MMICDDKMMIMHDNDDVGYNICLVLIIVVLDKYEWWFLNLMMLFMMIDDPRCYLGLVWRLWMIRVRSIDHMIHDAHRFPFKETLLKLQFEFDI